MKSEFVLIALPLSALIAPSAFAVQYLTVEQAQKAIVRLRQLDPTWRMSKLRDKVVFRRPEDVARIAEGLRRAGLPE